MIRRRFRTILFFFGRLLLTLALWDILLPRIGFGGWARSGRKERLRKAAVQFRLMAIKLGGVMIKVGQFLSTRADVLPVEITNELAGLQDEVSPEKFEDIRSVAEQELGLPLEQKYAFFDPEPLAAASLGQVHKARLWLVSESNHTPEAPARQVAVVVKVQRPNIQTIIDTDLAALRIVGGWLMRYAPIRRRVDIPALLSEFSRILKEEVDYLAEGVHAETFAANFSEIQGVRVPRVVWSHTSARVLTLEDVGGIKITDEAAIRAAGINPGEVSSRLINTYLKQIFDDGFFHADPHPGNLFVNPVPGGSWELTFVDFGMVGRVPANTRLALREMLVGVGTQDPARVVNSYKMLGILLPHADVEMVEKAESRLFERYWGKNMGELRSIDPRELTDLAKEFRELIYSLPFQVPHDLIFLARAVAILSGICTGLDPNFNIWHHIAPYAERIVSEEASSGGPEMWLGELSSLAQRLAALPRRAEGLLERFERGEVVVRDLQMVEQVKLVRKSLQKLSLSVIFLAFLIAAVQLYLGGSIQLALVSAGIGLFLLILLVKP